MKLLTLARDLQRRKARERLGLFVAEGVRATEELLRSPLRVRGILFGPALSNVPRGDELREMIRARGIPVTDVTEPEFDSAAGTDAPQGVLAIGEIPQRALATLELGETSRLLVLDAIQDPGNAGTLLRTAAALGVAATLALPGTVDLWNAKVVRSAVGALFHRPPVSTTWELLDVFLNERRVVLWGADTVGEPIDGLSAPARMALVVGNEGGGLSAQARRRVERVVTVPIEPGVESLNVAVAAGILLHHFRP
ncbi:MAG TPA: RNA methyltransferase [Gemmatimonadaceae bacterium]|nr:RNA methyltransferase [Gemmatimonadaceae bacterium]